MPASTGDALPARFRERQPAELCDLPFYFGAGDYSGAVLPSPRGGDAPVFQITPVAMVAALREPLPRRGVRYAFVVFWPSARNIETLLLSTLNTNASHLIQEKVMRHATEVEAMLDSIESNIKAAGALLAGFLIASGGACYLTAALTIM
jgi:hypothetical protein